MPHRTSGRRLARACVASLLIAAIAVVGTACEEAFGGPTISSVDIQPSTISTNNAGMSDEFFTVTISVIGFEAPIEEVGLSIVENNRPPPGRLDPEINGSTITIDRIQTKWFQDMEPDVYNIEATVTDENGTSASRSDLAQVEVTE